MLISLILHLRSQHPFRPPSPLRKFHMTGGAILFISLYFLFFVVVVVISIVVVVVVVIFVVVVI